jgi:hypothetical protein
MQFQLDEALAILARTPATLDAWLRDLPETWSQVNEGGDSWSPFDVLGHLVHGERTDWIPRARIILEHGPARTFAPFDHLGHRSASRGRTLPELLDEFATLRAASLDALRSLALGAADLTRAGRHPDLGIVTLEQLLATWVVHDLGHLGQIARVLAKQYAEAVGPWRAYLPVLDR